MARGFAAIVVALLIGCGPKAKPEPVVKAPPPAPAIRGTLSLDIEPADADVEVDGNARGKASELRALDLEPGPHQIVITKKGFEIWRGEVELAKASETIQVRLVPSK